MSFFHIRTTNLASKKVKAGNPTCLKLTSWLALPPNASLPDISQALLKLHGFHSEADTDKICLFPNDDQLMPDPEILTPVADCFIGTIEYENNQGQVFRSHFADGRIHSGEATLIFPAVTYTQNEHAELIQKLKAFLAALKFTQVNWRSADDRQGLTRYCKDLVMIGRNDSLIFGWFDGENWRNEQDRIITDVKFWIPAEELIPSKS